MLILYITVGNIIVVPFRNAFVRSMHPQLFLDMTGANRVECTLNVEEDGEAVGLVKDPLLDRVDQFRGGSLR